jgi:hypothetical protein
MDRHKKKSLLLILGWGPFVLDMIQIGSLWK